MKIKGIVFLLGILLLSACGTPSTKESYLSKFEAFIERVEKNHKEYKKHDWEYADKKLTRFNEEYYRKFEKELTLKEHARVGALSLKYHALKTGGNLPKKFKKEVKKDVKKLKEEIKYYIENDMDEDLDKLIEGAEEIGDSLGVVIEDLIEEIRNKL